MRYAGRVSVQHKPVNRAGLVLSFPFPDVPWITHCGVRRRGGVTSGVNGCGDGGGGSGSGGMVVR